MKLHFCKILTTKLLPCAKLSIVRAFFASFFLLSFQAIADDATQAAIYALLQGMDYNVDQQASDTSGIADDVHDMASDVESIEVYLHAMNQQGQQNEANLARLSWFFTGRTGAQAGNSVNWAATDTMPWLLSQINKSIKESGDILASNPWWNTNSAFVSTWGEWRPGKPSPEAPYGFSFAEVFSAFVSSLMSDESPEGDDWVPIWGEGGQNPDNWHYTWFDWMADAMKSNWVVSRAMGFASSTNEVLASLDGTGAEYGVYDEAPETNALEELTVDAPNITDMSPVLEIGESAGDWFPDVEAGDGDARFKLLTGGSYGAVEVAPVYVDFSVPASTYALIHIISTWLWRLLLFVGIFVIIRHEFDFWSTLGGSASG